MNIIQDPSAVPNMKTISESITGDARNRWLSLNEHIQDVYNAKPQVFYSKCSAKPGWNVKYKTSGKALCTLYPEPESFTALVVTAAADMEKFNLARAVFSDSFNMLYDRTQLFNNTKWLMIGVINDTLLSDVEKLLHLKTQK